MVKVFEYNREYEINMNDPDIRISVNINKRSRKPVYEDNDLKEELESLETNELFRILGEDSVEPVLSRSMKKSINEELASRGY